MRGGLNGVKKTTSLKNMFDRELYPSTVRNDRRKKVAKEARRGEPKN